MAHHLIFEGPELAGKSWLMLQVYDYLEAKYNHEKILLDGCHWFNCDVGVFGTEKGKFCIEKYTEILEKLNKKNVLFEKFHISDIVYSRINKNIKLDYSSLEEKLLKLNAKIILCSVKEDNKIFEKRIQDRLKLYPHYERILQNAEWYLDQQKEYLKEIKKTKLPYFEVDMSEIPNQKHIEILKWIGENYPKK